MNLGEFLMIRVDPDTMPLKITRVDKESSKRKDGMNIKLSGPGFGEKTSGNTLEYENTNTKSNTSKDGSVLGIPDRFVTSRMQKKAIEEIEKTQGRPFTQPNSTPIRLRAKKFSKNQNKVAVFGVFALFAKILS